VDLFVILLAGFLVLYMYMFVTCVCFFGHECAEPAMRGAGHKISFDGAEKKQTNQLAPCSFGLSTISQQYFSLRTNQPSAISQQYFSIRTKQHQPSATSQPNRLSDLLSCKTASATTQAVKKKETDKTASATT
jgi:hypothetical protein